MRELLVRALLRDVVTLALATTTLVIVKTLQSVIEAYEDDAGPDTDEVWEEEWVDPDGAYWLYAQLN